MVVQHNLTAMNSNRMLGVTTKQQAKTTEKLSSGYKINRAADDAAGLAISEKMRKQIRGLTQASANAQDGISAVQTAEGALTEVQDMLQRMNELAVKSSNGTQSESDRASIQAEIDQLATEIDRVAETTKFNETYLLKGDKDVAKSNSYSYKAVETTVAADAIMGQDKATNLTAKITFKDGANAASQNTVAKALRDQGITITSKQNMDETSANYQKEATYSVTLNGSAANSYKVNTITETGTNTGTAGDTKKEAEFEIVDLQGNKIATVKVSGGIGGTVAAESSKVITAETVKAAENQGDVKQFYDADGNAISENALGNYFSKLSPEGGTRTLYKADGTPITKAADIPDKTTLYEALTVTAAVGNTGTAEGVDISKVKGAVVGDVYKYDGKKWICQTPGTNSNYTANAEVKGITWASGSPATDDSFTVAVDTSKVANPGTATIATGASIYDATGKKLSNEELAKALDKDASVALYKANPLEVEAGSAKQNDGTALTVPPVLSGNKALAKGTWTYTAATGGAGGSWTDGNTTLSVTEMRDAISNYDAMLAGTKAPDTGTNFKVADVTGIATSGKIGATGIVAADYYTYTTDTATLNAEDVAAQAGKQLYDAVGNAYGGTVNTTTMAEAAKLVAFNPNLTGALNLSLHVGADATKNNQIELKIEAMSAKGLGINGIRVDGKNDSNALKSIETIKEALAKVSTQRSALGAVQNRLEHTINNLDNVVENTTSAESAIRDTDMATTMVQYSKNNILAQAGTSMLAQANQSNQSVLSLLQ